MSKLTIEIGAKIAGLVSGVDTAVRTVAGGARRMLSAFNGLGSALAGALSVRAIAGFAKSIIEVGDQIDNGSQKIQVSAQDYQKLAQAADIGGSSIETVEKSFKKMIDTIDDAGRGLKTGTEVLGRLGLTFDQLKDKTSTERFELVAKALREVSNEGERAALANDIFGRGGQELMPMISAYEGLGGSVAAMSDEAVRASAEFNDAITRLTLALRAMSAETGFISYLERIASEMENIVDLNRKIEASGAVTVDRGGFFGLLDDIATRAGFGAEGAVLQMPRANLFEGQQKRKKETEEKEERARVREVEAAKAAQAAAQKEADAEAKRIATADASVANALKGMEEKVRWQKMINDGKEREVAIENELAAAADKAKRPLTDDEKASLSASAGALFDLSQKAGKEDAARSPLLNDRTDITDAVRRIGGNIGSAEGNATANKTTGLLTDIKARLQSIDDKTAFDTGGNPMGAWPS